VPRGDTRPKTVTASAVREPDGSWSPVHNEKLSAAALAVSPLRIGGQTRENDPKTVGRRTTVAELASHHAHAAIAVLAGIMNDPNAAASERRLCATALLDRAFGRPAQSVDVDVKQTDMTQLHLAALRELTSQAVQGPKDITGYKIDPNTEAK
jgi:hypothetical protein